MGKNINEELLDAWLRLSLAINNDRVVSDMPFNEALICNILYRNQIQNPAKQLTATDLCNETKIQKSQMNRTLNSMEEKKIIRRERSSQDKRQVFVSLDMEQTEIYEEQHKKVLQIVDTLVDKIGLEKAEQIQKLFYLIAEIAEEVM